MRLALRILRDAAAPLPVKVFFGYAISWCVLTLTLAGVVLIGWLSNYVETPAVPYTFGFVALAVGVHGVAILSIRKSWGWTYDLVVIALGIGSCLFFICLPLLVYWVKPNVRRYMRRCAGN